MTNKFVLTNDATEFSVSNVPGDTNVLAVRIANKTERYTEEGDTSAIFTRTHFASALTLFKRRFTDDQYTTINLGNLVLTQHGDEVTFKMRGVEYAMTILQFHGLDNWTQAVLGNN